MGEQALVDQRPRGLHRGQAGKVRHQFTRLPLVPEVPLRGASPPETLAEVLVVCLWFQTTEKGLNASQLVPGGPAVIHL